MCVNYLRFSTIASSAYYSLDAVWCLSWPLPLHSNFLIKSSLGCTVVVSIYSSQSGSYALRFLLIWSKATKQVISVTIWFLLTLRKSWVDIYFDSLPENGWASKIRELDRVSSSQFFYVCHPAQKLTIDFTSKVYTSELTLSSVSVWSFHRLSRGDICFLNNFCWGVCTSIFIIWRRILDTNLRWAIDLRSSCREQGKENWKLY